LSDVGKFYNTDAMGEWNRLDKHRTEFAITMRAFEECLPPAPARILDIGGGPGRYAIELTKLGYEVGLIDIAQANIDLAHSKASKAGVDLHLCQQGTAVKLEGVATASYDVVLLMGPLYHLIEQNDRANAIREAVRVTKPGGLPCAAFINKMSPLRYAAAHDPTSLAKHRANFEELINDGILREPACFTDIFAIHPVEIAPLMESFGLETLKLINCEGLVGTIDAPVNDTDGDLWEEWVNLNYRYATDPSLLGASDHLLYIGRCAAVPG